MANTDADPGEGREFQTALSSQVERLSHRSMGMASGTPRGVPEAMRRLSGCQQVDEPGYSELVRFVECRADITLVPRRHHKVVAAVASSRSRAGASAGGAGVITRRVRRVGRAGGGPDIAVRWRAAEEGVLKVPQCHVARRRTDGRSLPAHLW